MVELVDTPDSKSCVLRDVPVQVRPAVPFFSLHVNLITDRGRDCSVILTLKATMMTKISIWLSILTLTAYFVAVIVNYANKDEYRGVFAVVIPATMFLILLLLNFLFITAITIKLLYKRKLIRRAPFIWFISVITVITLHQIVFTIVNDKERKQELSQPIYRPVNLE